MAEAAAATAGGAGMVAANVVRAAQRLEECRAQRRVEGDVDGAVAVLQAAAADPRPSFDPFPSAFAFVGWVNRML
jgi:hypothetical protein